MLLLTACVLLLTGLPVVAVLLGIASAFAALGLATGDVAISFLTALPWRLIGLLDNDILQALPLYVLMGTLLHRLPLADVLFRAGRRGLAATPAAAPLAAFGLGALLAPMNGSVGASVATLSRIVYPRLIAEGIPPSRSLALVTAASTLGVVVPPSLVLILLGDAMLRAHTEAVNATGIAVRIINTQDVFRSALPLAGIFLALSLAIAWWTGRRGNLPNPPQVRPVEWVTAAATIAVVVGLLAAVATGHLYAVEAAATGAAALLAYGFLSGRLNGLLNEILIETMAVTGALFGLFVAATTFTMVFRAFGTDKLLDTVIVSLPGGAGVALVSVLALLAVCGLVLDAFEIIFVIIPVVMPPLLVRTPDAAWVAQLTLLVLQASFLAPPLGYAVMMARGATGATDSTAVLSRALLPYLAAQLVVLGIAFAAPQLAHILDAPLSERGAIAAPSDEDLRKEIDDQQSEPLPAPDDP